MRPPAVRRALPAVVVCLAAAVGGTVALAAGGALDPAFSADGWVRTLEVRPPSYHPRGAHDVALQPDGKILVVGELPDAQSRSHFGVFRYTPGGELDTSFAGNGWAAVDTGSWDLAHAVAVQRDGKVLVGGSGTCDRSVCFAVVRFLADGSLDAGFGRGGVVLTRFARCGCHVNDLAVQRDGKIVAAGWRFRGGDSQDDQLVAVARYLPDGRLDRRFSRDGRVSFGFGYGDDAAWSVALQRDGRIVVAGGGGRRTDFAVARLRADGRLDRSFSGDGRQTVDFGLLDTAYALALQRDGRILLAGASATRYRPPRIVVARLRADGRLDRSFGIRGKRVTNPGTYGGSASAVVQHPDGRILAGGRVFEDDRFDASDWVLVRYTGNGKLDRSFGRGGVAVTDFGTGADWIGELAVQRDGKIVAAGSIYESQALARYRAR